GSLVGSENQVGIDFLPAQQQLAEFGFQMKIGKKRYDLPYDFRDPSVVARLINLQSKQDARQVARVRFQRLAVFRIALLPNPRSLGSIVELKRSHVAQPAQDKIGRLVSLVLTEDQRRPQKRSRTA